jgi:hypothetical protein
VAFGLGDYQGINYALGLDYGPILAGPDPKLVRSTVIEKVEEGIRTCGELSVCSNGSSRGICWVPARRAEFGSNMGIYQELPSRRDGGLSPFRHNPVKEAQCG